MREFERVGNQVYEFPKFIHEFGDSCHHMSMVRTCEFNEYGAPLRGTGRARANRLLPRVNTGLIAS